jgi:hypothetical protein
VLAPHFECTILLGVAALKLPVFELRLAHSTSHFRIAGFCPAGTAFAIADIVAQEIASSPATSANIKRSSPAIDMPRESISSTLTMICRILLKKLFVC